MNSRHHLGRMGRRPFLVGVGASLAAWSVVVGPVSGSVHAQEEPDQNPDAPPGMDTSPATPTTPPADSGALDFAAAQVAAGDGYTLMSYTINSAPPSPFVLPPHQLVVFFNAAAAVAAGDAYNPDPLLDQLIPAMRAWGANSVDPQQTLVQFWDTPGGGPPSDFVPSWPITASSNAGDRALREQILAEGLAPTVGVINTLGRNDPRQQVILDPLGSDANALRAAKGNLASRILWQANNEVWGWTINLALAYATVDEKGAPNSPGGNAHPAQGTSQSTAGLFEGGMRSTQLLQGNEVSNRYYLVRRYKTPQGVQIEVFLLPDALAQMNPDMLSGDIAKAVTDSRSLGTVNRVQIANSRLDMPDESKGPFQPYDSIKVVDQHSSARERTLAELDTNNGLFVLQPAAAPQYYAKLGTVLKAVNDQTHIK